MRGTDGLWMFRTQPRSLFYPDRNLDWINQAISHLRDLSAQGQFQEMQNAILTRRRFPQESHLENQAKKAYADLAKSGNDVIDAFSKLEAESIPDHLRPLVKAHSVYRKVIPYEPGFSILGLDSQNLIDEYEMCLQLQGRENGDQQARVTLLHILSIANNVHHVIRSDIVQQLSTINQQVRSRSNPRGTDILIDELQGLINRMESPPQSLNGITDDECKE
jgi:hypothetical protein